jgi:type II secretory pathway pseudopilin PulG
MFAVLLMSLLASAAALSFSQPLKAARAQDAMELIRSFDETGRQVARRFGHNVSLSFDLTTGKVSRLEGGQATYHATLPHGCRIRQVRTAARQASDGEISIPCSPLGVTRTYAVHLTGSGIDRWLLVSGFSGEVSSIKDEAQLDAIFAATAMRGEANRAEDAPDNSAGDDAH